MKPLTARQQDVFDFIAKTIQDSGLPPTRAEIALALGFRSPNAAEEHLKALKRKGFIDMIAGASRGIRLLHLASNLPTPHLAIIGQVAAGHPILAQEHIESYCPLAGNFFTPAADYLLRVKGYSMQNAGILEGDLLAIHRQAEARNGQIVIARIDEEVTVKRFFQQGARVILQPENPEFTALEFNLEQQTIAIEGIAVGLIRGVRSVSF